MKRVTSFLLVLVLFAGFVLTAAPTVKAASEMTASDDMIAVLKQEEGFSRTPYWDYAQYTVGYGTACPADMVDYYMENGITEEAAEVLLRNYLSNTENIINKKFIDQYGLTLTQGQFDALVSFTYNCGSAWISETSGTFHNAVKNGATGSELIRAFSLWCSAGGKILPGLVRRRLSEANMFLNQQYSRTAPENYCYVYFNPNGGSVSYKIQGYDSNLGTAPAYTPTYSGHTFLGWYTAQVGGSQVTTLTQDLSGITLYARWSSDEDNTPDTETGSDTPANQEIVVTVTGTNVNLRKGPGTNYGISGKVTAGDRLTIFETAQGSGYTWGRAYDNWVCLSYTNYNEVIAQLEQNKQETTAPTETTAPESSETETTAPETTVPETTVPETTAPETTVPETTEKKEIIVTVTGTNVRLRKGPGTGYGVAGTVTKGDRLTIFETAQGSGYTWGRAYDNWVCLKYTNYDAVVAQMEQNKQETTAPETTAPETTAPETTAPETTAPEATQPKEVIVTVTATNVRLRKGPGTGYGVTGTVTKGDRLTIFETAQGSGYTWGRAYDNWVCLKYTNYDAAVAQQGQNNQQTTAPETTAPETVPETTAPPATEPSASTAVAGTVKASGGLAVRNGPGTSHSVRKYLSNGSRVTITEQQNVNGVYWGNTGDGWVCLSYVTLDAPIQTPAPDTGSDNAVVKTVNTSCLRIRSGASSSASIVGYVYRRDRLTIFETVQAEGITWGRSYTGWVCMDYMI